MAGFARANLFAVKSASVSLVNHATKTKTHIFLTLAVAILKAVGAGRHLPPNGAAGSRHRPDCPKKRGRGCFAQSIQRARFRDSWRKLFSYIARIHGVQK